MLCDRYEPVSQGVSGERDRELHVYQNFIILWRRNDIIA